MEGIPVRYKLGIAVPILGAGVFTLLTGLLLGGMQLIFVGGLNTMMGLGFILQPWFVVFDDRVEIRNLFGMTMRKHTFGSLSEIELRGNKLYKRGEERPLRGAGGWLARGSDLEVLQAALK